MFKPTYLYIKTHKKTKLKYFGKTIKTNPHKYNGSGTRWLNHINYHGNSSADIETVIVGYYTDEESCKHVAITFSKTNNIVESSEWANLEIENGIHGGTGLIGQKNGSYGTRWITNGKANKKIQKDEKVLEGWWYGMTVRDGWGDNISKKLKGRTHVEMLGEEKAKELSESKRQRGKKLKGKLWGKNKSRS